MNLDADIDTQLDGLDNWLRQFAESYETPPSVEMWKELQEGLIERADFLSRYITPKVRRLLNGERLTLRAPVPRIATYEPIGGGHAVAFVGTAGEHEP